MSWVFEADHESTLMKPRFGQRLDKYVMVYMYNYSVHCISIKCKSRVANVTMRCLVSQYVNSRDC